jgi:hypothetical protein
MLGSRNKDQLNNNEYLYRIMPYELLKRNQSSLEKCLFPSMHVAMNKKSLKHPAIPENKEAIQDY